jgi:hypothetical protein
MGRAGAALRAGVIGCPMLVAKYGIRLERAPKQPFIPPLAICAMPQRSLDYIKSLYKEDRKVHFELKRRTVNEGIVKDVILVKQSSEYIKGAELLQFKGGVKEIRFMYWANLSKGKRNKDWKWGQFSASVPIGITRTIFNRMKNKGWI